MKEAGHRDRLSGPSVRNVGGAAHSNVLTRIQGLNGRGLGGGLHWSLRPSNLYCCPVSTLAPLYLCSHKQPNFSHLIMLPCILRASLVLSHTGFLSAKHSFEEEREQGHASLPPDPAPAGLHGAGLQPPEGLQLLTGLSIPLISMQRRGEGLGRHLLLQPLPWLPFSEPKPKS